MKLLQTLFYISLIVFGTLPLAFSQEGRQIPFQLKQKEGEKLSPEALNQGVEQALMTQTNALREKKKLKILNFNQILQKAARDHSSDMMKRKYLSHFSPEGKSVLDRLQRYTKVQTDVGENLHTIGSPRGLTDPQAIATQMIKDWEGSPSHRKNLLGKQFTQMGVGCRGDGIQIYCTQVFSGPRLP